MKQLIELKDLSVIINNNYILRKLNLDIYKGEILGIIGASGGGKSVLLRTILGLQHYDEGEVVFHVTGNLSL